MSILAAHQQVARVAVPLHIIDQRIIPQLYHAQGLILLQIVLGGDVEEEDLSLLGGGGKHGAILGELHRHHRRVMGLERLQDINASLTHAEDPDDPVVKAHGSDLALVGVRVREVVRTEGCPHKLPGVHLLVLDEVPQLNFSILADGDGGLVEGVHDEVVDGSRVEVGDLLVLQGLNVHLPDLPIGVPQQPNVLPLDHVHQIRRFVFVVEVDDLLLLDGGDGDLQDLIPLSVLDVHELPPLDKPIPTASNEEVTLKHHKLNTTIMEGLLGVLLEHQVGLDQVPLPQDQRPIVSSTHNFAIRHFSEASDIREV
mmetsp:Transcript_1195/g.1214  ORF Transcript_1195/g.1214 Transcript_1195/m.1214 type:complete len:312 (+) Transcript_1195:3819-4754(+)